MQLRRYLVIAGFLAAAVVATVSSCGKKEIPHDTNLLKNGSFEEMGKGGLPEGWSLVNFRGIVGEEEIRYQVDNTESYHGASSFRFQADPGTKRFYALQQEVEVPEGTTHVRLSGWLQLDHVDRKSDQWAQCNFLLTFFDENHLRFQELRFADKRTRLKIGTLPWTKESHKFRVPRGTRFVAVSCILGMDGTAWFDDVSLEIPEALDWQSVDTANYTFYWLPGHPFPAEAMQNQQRLFQYVCAQLQIQSDVKIGYYLYPDTATIRRVLSIKGYQYLSWDDREMHTINPNDRHELVHFITDPYGRPPRSVAEGLVYYLHDDWAGYPIDKVAAYRMASSQLPTLASMTNYNEFARLDAGLTIPSMASFTGFILKRWGPAKLLEFFGQVNGFNSWSGFTQAFERVYDVPCETVEESWHTMLRGVDISDLPELPADIRPEKL